MGVTRGEIVEAELDRLIEKRAAPEDPEAKEALDAYLAGRPSENRAWDAYTEAHRDAQASRGYESMLARGLAERAFSSEAAG